MDFTRTKRFGLIVIPAVICHVIVTCYGRVYDSIIVYNRPDLGSTIFLMSCIFLMADEDILPYRWRGYQVAFKAFYYIFMSIVVTTVAVYVGWIPFTDILLLKINVHLANSIGQLTKPLSWLEVILESKTIHMIECNLIALLILYLTARVSDWKQIIRRAFEAVGLREDNQRRRPRPHLE